MVRVLAAAVLFRLMVTHCRVSQYALAQPCEKKAKQPANAEIESAPNVAIAPAFPNGRPAA
jgi:hypothetical protein